MSVIVWKLFCVVLALTSIWFAAAVGRNIWRALITGSTRRVHPEAPVVSRRIRAGNYWLFVAFNLAMAGIWAASAAMWVMLLFDMLPTIGLEPS